MRSWKPLPTNTVLLFGPHVCSDDIEQYNQLRSALLEDQKYQWALRAISELPGWWQTIVKALPPLDHLVPSACLECWRKDLETNDSPPSVSFPLPNVLLGPLVVIAQLMQYERHRRLDDGLSANSRTETMGLGMGLLSAAAVSSSASPDQLQKYGAVAIRLALLIGAILDAANGSTDSSNSVSYSVAWAHSYMTNQIDETLHQYPDASMSVLSDDRKATLTAPRDNAETLARKLSAIAGVSVGEIGLGGRFHSRHYADYYADVVLGFCDLNPAFQFPEPSQLAFPIRSNVERGHISTGKLHHMALESILLLERQRYRSLSNLSSSLPNEPGSTTVLFSLDRWLFPSLKSKLGSQIVDAASLGPQQAQNLRGKDLLDTDIAVVGMACKLPGADDLEEFWQLLCEGESQHQEVPAERMSFDNFPWRREGKHDTSRKWYGNFVCDYDAFDHKFFKKSPREAATMDPQQRLMLQTAYQAVAQAGHFSSNTIPRDVACYIGVSNVDYENQVASYPANAYSATGALKSFVAGKVSHFFGWTGPSVTVDTSCSSAAVALHQACQSLLAGDCAEALSGGVNVLASPLWYQNLAGASFLSQTGPCKPFDARADGYCRAEGCGAVVLKKAKAAVADGNQIFGIIAGTAVQQNENCTPITVPNSISLSDLFRNGLSRSQINPSDISVVEAHGTGTAVGDPAEYESLRSVLGGPLRENAPTLTLGSVKSLVGHLECASGVASLLKVLLMVKKATIPPQIGLETVNPAIKANPADGIKFASKVQPWQVDFRAALINNYGASGSNACMVVKNAPYHHQKPANNGKTSLMKVPFYFSAFDMDSLRAYCARFLSYIRSGRQSSAVDSLSFNLFRQSNRLLTQFLTFSVADTDELKHKLEEFQAGNLVSQERKWERPVILCFGGQVSTFVGLNREVFDSTVILRSHLDECDRACQQLGFEGIYPEVFQKAPIEDSVTLQLILFALQYACAKSWMDCGVQVAAVVGHSFGELTSLCVAGVLSLHDALKLVSGRARLVRDSWGPDKGGMIAVEGQLPSVEALLKSANESHQHGPAIIACVNGPTSFTLAGPTKAIDAIQARIQDDAQFSSMKKKRLNVSNAFHSILVDPLVSGLEEIGRDLVFKTPNIPIERATESASPPPSTAAYVADHMRNAVRFNEAVHRLSEQYPSAVWLEAGSNSTITVMASRALGGPPSSHFQAVNITSDTSSAFADTFTSLWAQGLGSVTFWPHHGQQGAEYPALFLPPYQFEKARHSLEIKELQLAGAVASMAPAGGDSGNSLWSRVGNQDCRARSARFLIHTRTAKFEEYVSGHTAAHSAPLCPSTLQLELAIETIQSLCPQFAKDMQPQLQGLDNHNPVCLDPGRTVFIEVEALNAECHAWEWKMSSQPSDSQLDLRHDPAASLHVSGTIAFRSTADAQFQAEFSRFERLADHQQCLQLLRNDDADEVLQGRNIYRSFAEVVDYGEIYRGVHRVVSKGNRSAGRVKKKYTGETWLDCPLCDSFCQVAGIFVNCMTERPDDNFVYISNRVEQLIRSPRHPDMDPAESPDFYDVLAIHSRPSDKMFLSDVFIFDPRNGELLGVILGIQYQKANKIALGKLLMRLTYGKESNGGPAVTVEPATTSVPATTSQLEDGTGKKTTSQSDIAEQALGLVASVSGNDANKVKTATALADIGIDSLMGMELARDIEGAFNCRLDTMQLMELTDFNSLVNCIMCALGICADTENDPDRDKMSDSTDKNDSTVSSQTGVTSPGEDEEELTGKDQRSSTADALSGLERAYSNPYPSRQATVDEYVRTYTKGFAAPAGAESRRPTTDTHVVLVTGATGSLGSHLVAALAAIPQVQRVICLNRLSGMDPELRQRQAFESRGIATDPSSYAKISAIETDVSKPLLGVAASEYEHLTSTVTHIIHNAWPMTVNRPVSGFEIQFQSMRNLIDFAREAACMRPQESVGFLFISSIATVGLYPLWTGENLIPEERMTTDSALPSGYSEAKLVCEDMLEATLRKYPESFNASVARIGQIAGSTTSGFWNPVEHLPFLFKSCQALNAFPDFRGDLSWCPVNDVATVLGEILLSQDPAAHIYHVENPERQSWAAMIQLLADELGVSRGNIVPFPEWLERMRRFPDAKANPAKRVEAFLDDHFVRMACGGVTLDTQATHERSPRLKGIGVIGPDLVKRYVQGWRDAGFVI